MPRKIKRLNPQDCQKKAIECRELASLRTMPDAHRVMLQHIAETWERIAQQSVKVGKKKSSLFSDHKVASELGRKGGSAPRRAK